MKLSDIKPLYEIIFTGTADVNWNPINNGFMGRFTFKDKDYGIRLINCTNNSPLYGKLSGKTLYDVQFGDVDENGKLSMIATNTGFPYDILGIVQNATIAKFRDEGMPDAISASVSTDLEFNTPKQTARRSRIYSNMLKGIKQQLGYKNIYENIVGRDGIGTLMCNVDLTPDDLHKITQVLMYRKTPRQL